MSDLIERLRGRANGFQRRHGGDALAERDAEIQRLMRERDEVLAASLALCLDKVKLADRAEAAEYEVKRLREELNLDLQHVTE
jgi:hypothetical protein